MSEIPAEVDTGVHAESHTPERHTPKTHTPERHTAELHPAETYDSIVLGAGVAGSASALALAKRGRERVLLLERFAPLHKNGSSHGGSRIFRHAYEDARYVELAVAADEAWRALEREAGETLLHRSGGLDIGVENNPELAGIARGLQEAGRPFDLLDHREVKGRFPAFRLTPRQAALYQPDAGVLPASFCVQIMQREAQKRGVILRAQEPVLEVTLGDPITLTTARGRYRTERLVVTAGPWLSEELPGLELRLPLHINLHVERQQVLYLRAPEPSYALGKLPVFIDRDSNVYGLPAFEVQGAIKVSDHTGAPRIRLSERNFELEQEAAARTVTRAKELMPGLSGELLRFETCLYTKTPDEHFILDRHPVHASVAVGGGFSGHGFKFGPLLGDILADLACGESPPFDLSLFGLARFGRAP